MEIVILFPSSDEVLNLLCGASRAGDGNDDDDVVVQFDALRLASYLLSIVQNDEMLDIAPLVFIQEFFYQANQQFTICFVADQRQGSVAIRIWGVVDLCRENQGDTGRVIAVLE